MTRLLLILAAPAFLLTLAPAAPVPKGASDGLQYHPVKKGTTWVYTTWDNESTCAITDVEKKDGAYRVTISRESQGEFVFDQLLEVSGQGVALLAAFPADLDEPFWILRIPVNDGKRWDTVMAISGVGKGAAKATVRGPEWVQVPAGKYRAIRVEMDQTYLDERWRRTTWYAPGVGKVREVNGKVIEVLKKFVPGNDEQAKP